MSRTQGRDCAVRVREIRRRRSSTFRCLETACWVIANGSASWLHRRVTLSQALEDRAPGRVGQRREHQAQLVVNDWHGETISTTGSLHNHIVVECQRRDRPPLGSRLRETALVRIDDDLHPVAQAQFHQDPRDVGLDGRLAHERPPRSRRWTARGRPVVGCRARGRQRPQLVGERGGWCAASANR